MENLDDFIDHDVPPHIILQYYFVFIPEITRLMLPVSVLLAALFTAGKMSSLNELTAIKSSGISLYRYTAPFLVTALIISLLAIYFGGYVVPFANKHKVYIERNYMKKGIVRTGSNIFFQDSPTRIVTISYYDILNNKANRVSIENFNKTNPTVIDAKVDARMMKYDSTKRDWVLHRGIKRIFNNTTEKVVKFDSMRINDLNFTPSEVIKKQRKPEEMTLSELKDYETDLLNAGNDPTRIEIEYDSRIAFAFANFVVVLFGLTISSNRRRGGLAVQFGISVLFTFIYLVLMKISVAFGKNGLLDPLLTAWGANILFLIAGIVNLVRVRK